jgi:hypothetical protein
MNMTRQPMNMTMESIGKRIYEEESNDATADEEEEEGNANSDTADLAGGYQIGGAELSSTTPQPQDSNPADDWWPFQCAACAQKCRTKDVLQAHVQSHNAAKPHKCSVCGLGFVHKGDRRRHEASLHHNQHAAGEAAPTRHACAQCSKSFSRRSDLNVHQKRVHGTDRTPRISCQGCAQIFASEKEATRHKCSKSNNSKNKREEGLKCELCSALLSSRIEWGVHMWKHTKDAAFIIMSETDPLPVFNNNAAAKLISTR